MELQQVCQGIVGESEGVLACGLVDLDTGLMLAEERSAGAEAEAAGLVRCADLTFRSPLMEQFVAALPHRRSLVEYVQEAQITTANTRQYLSVLPGRPNTVLVLVTNKAMSIGLGWMTVRQSEARFGPPERPREVREVDAEAVAAEATRARAERVAEPPAVPPVTAPRTEPRVAAPATVREGVAARTGVAARAGVGVRAGEKQGAGRMATGLRGHRPAVPSDAESDKPDEPADATKPVTRVGARASIRQKT